MPQHTSLEIFYADILYQYVNQQQFLKENVTSISFNNAFLSEISNEQKYSLPQYLTHQDLIKVLQHLKRFFKKNCNYNFQKPKHDKLQYPFFNFHGGNQKTLLIFNKMIDFESNDTLKLISLSQCTIDAQALSVFLKIIQTSPLERIYLSEITFQACKNPELQILDTIKMKKNTTLKELHFDKNQLTDEDRINFLLSISQTLQKVYLCEEYEECKDNHLTSNVTTIQAILNNNINKETQDNEMQTLKSYLKSLYDYNLLEKIKYNNPTPEEMKEIKLTAQARMKKINLINTRISELTEEANSYRCLLTRETKKQLIEVLEDFKYQTINKDNINATEPQLSLMKYNRGTSKTRTAQLYDAIK